MAKIQLSNLVATAAGKIGGTIFQRNRYAMIARSLTIPVQPSSNRKTAQQALQVDLLTRWSNLTINQRTAWNTWAQYQGLRVGTFTSVDQPGQLAYIQANRYRALTQAPLQHDPVFTPHNRPLLSTTQVRRIPGPSNLTIVLSREPNPSLERLILYASPTVKASVNAPRRLLFILVPTSDYAQDIDIKEQYAAAYGRLPLAGEHLFIETAILQLDNSTLSIFQRNRYPITN